MLLLLLVLICCSGQEVRDDTGFSSTPSPRDQFIQAINENVIEEITQSSESPFVNFSPEPPREQSTARPSTPPPVIDQFPSYESPQNFEPPRRPGNRLQVDEEGNPLGDVQSTDTTRSELSSGGDPVKLRCPRNWERYRDSCYKFTRSPPKKWDDAREICKTFRHDDQDRADLASIDTFEEHRYVEC